MKSYRILAEVSYLMEAEVQADSLEQAKEMADNLDEGAYHVWDDTGMTNTFEVMDVEEVR